jgi:uncharacterized protein
VISLHVQKLSSLRSTRGQMFRERIEPIYFETRFGIHTFFVKKPIDVVILDENNVVQKVKHSLKPWRIFIWNPKLRKVVELPHGTISNRKLTVGSKVEIKG